MNPNAERGLPRHSVADRPVIEDGAMTPLLCAASAGILLHTVVLSRPAAAQQPDLDRDARRARSLPGIDPSVADRKSNAAVHP